MSDSYEVVLCAGEDQVVLVSFKSDTQRTKLQREIAQLFHGRTAIDVVVGETHPGTRRGDPKSTFLGKCTRLDELQRALVSTVSPHRCDHCQHPNFFSRKLKPRSGKKYKEGEVLGFSAAEFRVLRARFLKPEVIQRWELE